MVLENKHVCRSIPLPLVLALPAADNPPLVADSPPAPVPPPAPAPTAPAPEPEDPTALCPGAPNREG